MRVSVEIDGSGKAEVETGVGFLDHILHLLAHHSGMDLVVEARVIRGSTITTPSRIRGWFLVGLSTRLSGTGRTSCDSPTRARRL